MLGKLIENEHEAIEAIKSNMPTSGYYMLREALEMAMQALEEIQQYRAIGSVEECRAAMEKQNAIKPIFVQDSGIRYTDTYRCPKCGGTFTGTGIADYCYHCGQAIDWTEGE